MSNPQRCTILLLSLPAIDLKQWLEALLRFNKLSLAVSRLTDSSPFDSHVTQNRSFLFIHNPLRKPYLGIFTNLSLVTQSELLVKANRILFTVKDVNKIARPFINIFAAPLGYSMYVTRSLQMTSETQICVRVYLDETQFPLQLQREGNR